MAKGNRGGKRGKYEKVDTSYQGKSFAKAIGTGKTVDLMASEIQKLPPKVASDNKQAINVIKSVKGKPNKVITIYRATVGKSINANDWVFLDKPHAESWTTTAFGTPKPGVKVVSKRVKAKDVDWTGKNLEFMYKG